MVALPLRLLRLLPGHRYGRCLVAAVVLFVLQRWVRVGTRQVSVSEQQEGGVCVISLPGQCSIKFANRHLADGTKAEASEESGGVSFAVRKVKASDSPVRRSAQQCWRNAVVSLPTGKVRR